MTKKVEKWYNHGWTYVIGGVFLAPFGTFVFDWIKEVKIFTSIKELFIWVLTGVKGFLLYQAPMWHFLILLTIILLAYRLYQQGKQDKLESVEITTTTVEDVSIEDMETAVKMEIEPNLLAYTADKFDTLVFKWAWAINKLTKKYEVKNVTAVCPRDTCDYNELIYAGYDGEFGNSLYACSKCKKTFGDSYSTKSIINEIENKFKPLT